MWPSDQFTTFPLLFAPAVIYALSFDIFRLLPSPLLRMSVCVTFIIIIFPTAQTHSLKKEYNAIQFNRIVIASKQVINQMEDRNRVATFHFSFFLVTVRIMSQFLSTFFTRL